MIKYPSIGQYRNIVADIRRSCGIPPTLMFHGSVKVHGSNAAVVVNKDGQYAQSRNRVLTLEDDNLGFAKWHSENQEYFQTVYDFFECEEIVFFGEWAGKGIQKGVGVSESERFFYIFDVVMDDKWVMMESDDAVFNYLSNCEHKNIILNDSVGSIEINFGNPSASIKALTEHTEEVEAHCPVAQSMGVDGIGEGVVWKCIASNGELLMFKVKGKKHSVTKTKTLAPVDVEKLSSIEAFVDYAVTENRLKQGFFTVCDNVADRRMLGDFIKWISGDVHKEESDALESNDLTMKDIGRPLSVRAKNWFFNQELEL